MSSLVTKEEYKKQLIEIINSTTAVDRDVSVFKEKLEDSSNFGEYPTNPGEIKFEIDDCGEKAFQRALLLSDITLLDFKSGSRLESVDWIDGELPVVLNRKSRRLCVDLVGTLGGIPTLCELKFSNQKNSPEYGAIQLLTYWGFIQFNSALLDKYNVYHKNRKQFKWEVFTKNQFPSLIVCGTKSYWNYWFEKKKIDRKALKTKVLKWGMALDTNIYLFQSDDFNFKSQKTGKKKYTPSIPDKGIWTRV